MYKNGGDANRGTWTALPLVDAARHNDAKPKLGRELMILTHDDDDDDVCMYVACLRRPVPSSVVIGCQPG